MPVQMLIGNKVAGKIGTLQLDATLDESHEYESAVTRFPVENGSDITDHIRNAPIRLDMTGLVTNNPVVVVGKKSDLDGYDYVGNFVNLAFDEMIRIRVERKPITVVTGLRVYNNMAMTSLSIPRSAGIGDTFRFRASFIEIRIVSTETVLIPNLSNSVEDKGASTADNGKQTGKEATVEQKKKVSMVKKVINKVVDYAKK